MEDFQLKEVLALVREINRDQFRESITEGDGYEQLIAELKFLAEEKKYWINRSEEILEKLMAMSAGEFHTQVSAATRDSELEAIILGINSFAEEIEASTITKEEYLDSLNSLPYIVWSSNIDFSKVLFVNKATELIFGISQEEMLENKNLWVDVIHPDDREYVESAFDDFFETGEFNVEYRCINRKTSELKWIHDRAHFLNDTNGERYRIVGSCKDVTLEKESILKNKDTTNKLILAQHFAQMGSWDFNLSTQEVEWSDELYVIFGLDPSLKGEQLFYAYREAIHPDDIELLDQRVMECATKGVPYDFEHRIFVNNRSELKYIRAIGNPVYDAEGKIIGLSGIGQDFTDKKLIEIQNEKNQKRLEEAQQISKIGSWELNLVSGNLYWSKEHYHIFEIDVNTPPEILYDTYRSRIHPEDLAKLDGLVEKTMQTGVPFEFYHRALLLEGKERFVKGIGNAIFGLNNEIVGIQGTAQDITNEIQQQDKLNATLADLNAILDATDYSIIATDLNGTITLFNKGAERILGYKAEDVVGKTSPAFIHVLEEVVDRAEVLTKELGEQINPGFDVFIAKLNRFGVTDINEWTYVRKDGSKLPVILTCDTVKDVDGNITGYIGIAKDITSENKKQAVDDFVVDISRSILHEGKEADFYAKILNGVITLLESEYGFIGEVFTDEESKQPYLRTYALTNIAWNDETRKFYDDNVQKGLEFRNLNTLFGYALKHTEIVIANDPMNDQRKGGLPHGHPPLNAFLGIPIFSGVEMVGMIGLANKKGGYTMEDVAHISSFTSLFGSIIQSNKIDRNKHLLEVENNKIRSEIQNFFSMSSDFMAIVSPEGFFERVNQIFITKLGYTEDELIGKHVSTIVHPDDLSRVKQDFEEVENNKEVTFLETDLRYVSKNQEIFWVNFKIVIDYLQNKHYAYGRDITQQKAHDIQLREALKSVQDYKTALNQIAIVSITNLQGDITFANEMFSKISGYTIDELIGQNHRLLKSDQNPEGIFEDLWKTISSGNTWRGEVCNKNKFGQFYWVDTLIVPLLDESGKPKQYFSIRYEITEKKQQEHLKSQNEELQKGKEVAEQKTKLKERFLANMSHEIRTPMNSILGLSNLMEKVGTLNPKQMDYIKTIKLNSKNLLSIINDILDLSKIEEGKLEVEQSTFDVVELVKNVEKSLVLTAHKKKIALVAEIDSHVPKFLIGDSTRLNQVLINLTNNAIKFTLEGSVKITVKLVNLVEKKATVYFGIEDTGIGIDPSKIDSIFEPFTQEKSSTTRLFGGTGLGLTISNQIIHAFGAQIQVKSQPNVGSTFNFEVTFDLPENRIDVSKEFDIPSYDTKNTELKGKYRILLVEDNPFNQMVAEDTLKDWNGELEIDIAENGVLAIEKLKHKVYDLVLMDIQMPELDGHGATKIARQELGIQIPILAMTAQATPAEIEACLHSGMNDYISKPFDEQVLFAKIVRWLNNDLLI